MTQLILVYIIIAAAIIYVIFSVIRSLRHKTSANDCESGCDGCSGCDIKKEITKNIVQNTSKKPVCGCH